MRVYKFGGASVNDAEGVKNITKIIKNEQLKDLVIVISAMGKMTNAFEKLIKNYIEKQNVNDDLDFIKSYHLNIINQLFENKSPIYDEFEMILKQINSFFEKNKNLDYDYLYDQIVIYGELISTKIISQYFLENNVENTWLDARNLIHTDNQFRNANVDWATTCQNIISSISEGKIYITQGFIGSASADTHTTLGREGSDYSASIFSYCLDAEQMTIWKDVPGVLNADPRYFENTILLEKISYEEALEMAFYGATIIHPKTIKPLENKDILLNVRSFLYPNQKGTIISKDSPMFPKSICYTLKENQILLSISTKDFSFMIEHNISHLFQLFAEYKIKVNLIQNSAISFSVCIEDLYNQFINLITVLSDHYNLEYNERVKLISIRHYSKEILDYYVQNHEILLLQETDNIAQIIIK